MIKTAYVSQLPRVPLAELLRVRYFPKDNPT